MLPGAVYFDKTLGVIGIVLRNFVLETYAARTLYTIFEITEVYNGSILLSTNYGEEVLDITGFGVELGFTKEEMITEYEGLEYYLEGIEDENGSISKDFRRVG